MVNIMVMVKTGKGRSLTTEKSFEADMLVWN